MIAKCLDLLESSSVPGVPILFKSKQITTKIVWLLTTLILLAYSIKYVVDSIQSYYNYEKVTSINVYRDFSPQFPAISFCMNFSNLSIPNLSDIILFCQYDEIKCNASDFEMYYGLTERACYRFNSGNNKSLIKNSTKNTLITGLNVLLKVANFRSSNRYFGIKTNAYINNASSIFMPHRPCFPENINNLVIGANSIKIEREFIERLAQPMF